MSSTAAAAHDTQIPLCRHPLNPATEMVNCGSFTIISLGLTLVI
ncbi:hypothetical protein [Kineobactrum sediminis]|nr:hypothetical protein [Kineobactrum sediminis]